VKTEFDFIKLYEMDKEYINILKLELKLCFLIL